jgi:hypothetical protein
MLSPLAIYDGGFEIPLIDKKPSLTLPGIAVRGRLFKKGKVTNISTCVLLLSRGFEKKEL